MPGMDILLDRQQVHQGIVDDGMRPVAVAVQQATKGVFHGAGDGGENVGFYSGQVDHIHPHQSFGDKNALGIDFIQHQERLFGLVFDPLEILVVKVQAGHVVLVGDELVFVIDFGIGGIHNHRIVVHAYQIGITGMLQRADDAFNLPGGGRAGRDTRSARKY